MHRIHVGRWPWKPRGKQAEYGGGVYIQELLPSIEFGRRRRAARRLSPCILRWRRLLYAGAPPWLRASGLTLKSRVLQEAGFSSFRHDPSLTDRAINRP